MELLIWHCSRCPFPEALLSARNCFRERPYLVVPESHRLSSHSTVHLKRVERDPFLLLKDGHCFRENTLSACGRARIRPNVVFESGQFTTILAMVGGGTGVSVVPQMAVERRKGCRFIPIADEGAYRRVGIVQLKQHFRSRAHTTFLQIFLRGLGQKAEARPVSVHGAIRRARCREDIAAVDQPLQAGA